MKLNHPNYARERLPLLVVIWLDLLRYSLLSRSQLDKPCSTLKIWLALFSPRTLPVTLFRLSHFFGNSRIRFLGKLLGCLNHLIFGLEISISCRIGPGLFLPHTQGTVVGAWSIGSNVTIFQGVTIGARSLDFNPSPLTRPIIGDGVVIGAGAKVLGAVHLHDHCLVGANSVVLQDIPDGCLAVGAPARIISRT